ncbi:alr0857 family protein [Leptolyngbya ohadii]|uniref:alr0857 family protein n=1 Tax=Leptolyngbya ohadii TaxID=1962290 RepID=UPI000B5A016B|nr:alr0857 family protein [Leptolyngbya ohadii]
MLKLTYTEVGLWMERTMITPEQLMQERVVLAMRLGQPLYLESGRASFLLPADVPELEQLEWTLRQECSPTVTVMPVDEAFVEVAMSGCWVAQDREAHAGMFLTVMSDRAEFFLYKLWQMTEAQISSLASG